MAFQPWRSGWQVMRESSNEPGPQNFSDVTLSDWDMTHSPSEVVTSDHKAVPAAFSLVDRLSVVCWPHTNFIPSASFSILRMLACAAAKTPNAMRKRIDMVAHAAV